MEGSSRGAGRGHVQPCKRPCILVNLQVLSLLRTGNAAQQLTASDMRLRSTALKYCGMAIAAKIPRMSTTTSNSIRVKPFLLFFMLISSGLQNPLCGPAKATVGGFKQPFPARFKKCIKKKKRVKGVLFCPSKRHNQTGGTRSGICFCLGVKVTCGNGIKTKTDKEKILSYNPSG